MIADALQIVQSLFVSTTMLAIALAGLGGFLGCWWMNFTNRMPSILAIPVAAICLSLTSYVFSWSSATKTADLRCEALQSDARAEGEKAGRQALKQIMDEQNRRLSVSEEAAATSKKLADRLKLQLEEAEEKRAATESKINELEQSLPENPNCTTSNALHGELSD